MNPMLAGIKNIIFDLGGVILNIDYNLSVGAFKRLGVEGFDKQYAQLSQQALFDAFEKGELSSDDFREQIQRTLAPALSFDQIDAAWNALLLDLPRERLAILTELKPQYRTFLLSNTNAIHMNAIENYLQKHFKVSSFDPFFERVYLSYQMGKRKPDAGIFEQVLLENALHPNETLFIDDSPQHVKTANALGIKTIHLVQPQTITQIFRQP